MSRFNLFYILILLICNESLYSQGLILQTNQRRCFDEIHLELWLKTSKGYYPNIAYGNFIIKYDSSSLSLLNEYTLKTDTISANIDQINPVVDINSPLSNINGLTEPKITTISNNRIKVEFRKNNQFSKGFIPSDNGKGTFLSIIKFKIKENVTNKSITGIELVKDSCLVFDADSTDLSDVLTLSNEKDYKVLGINVLYPKYINTVIHRNKNYLSLTGSYFGKGFPIYFERSINPSKYNNPGNIQPAIDQNLGYVLEYNSNNIWREFGRFIENDRSASSIFNNGLYYTGDINNPNTGTSYIITSHRGGQLNKDNFRQPLRVLLSKNLSYTNRDDKIYLRLTQLDGKFGTLLNNWEKDTIQSETIGPFVTGRIFFLQLNGTNEFLRTNENISNSTQLTVEAWINLHTIKSNNSEPAIVASSAGPNGAPVNGSKEGSWMLYLKNGKYPAFRVREIENRGKNGYLASLVSHFPIDAVPATQIYEHSFDRNWNHIAATINNNIVKLYLNGELVDEFRNDSAMDVRMLVTNHPIWIGLNPNISIEANDYLGAGIKSVRIWKVALTQDEIRRYASGITNPNNIGQIGDIRRGLLMYYYFSGDLADYADEKTLQGDSQNLIFFKSFNPQELSIPFKPDNPHIKITSPSKNSGLVNLAKNIYEIRWLSYEIGDISRNNSRDIEFEYSLDGGINWFAVKDSLNRNLTGNTAPETEQTTANWEPYLNNDFNANLRSIEPFIKKVLLRGSGTIPNAQKQFYYISDTLKIAPYFSLFKGSNTIISTDIDNTINFVNNENLIEMWIKPYKFPSSSESYISLISKVDTLTQKEFFSLRLLANGQLQFNILDKTGKIRTAKSDINYPIYEPNSISVDTPWTHIAVYFNTKYQDTATFIRFYIDGNPQNNDLITNQLGKSFEVDNGRNIPTYFFSLPALKSNKSGIYIGEFKEFRHWKSPPKEINPKSNQDELTLFIQGALSVRSKKFKQIIKSSLDKVISFNGGIFHYYGKDRILKSDDFDNFYLIYYNTTPEFKETLPFIKSSEPVFRQRVSNRNDSLRIRWVGFDYSSSDLPLGAPQQAPFVEYSLLGGGGNQPQPYKFVGSRYWSGNTINSLSIPDNHKYIFKYSDENIIFAANLDLSKANPDKNNDGQTNDQGELPATLTNARLKYNLKYRVFNSIGNLSAESQLFTITPSSNFTVRIIPEGYYNGKDNLLRPLGNSYETGGIKIKIYEDNNGNIGKLVDSAESFFGYSDRNPANLNNGNNKFANIDFVFNDLKNKEYWCLVEHINHLPVLSRFAAPYLFTGDNPDTWRIESGWDFTSWDGRANNYLPNSKTDPWANGYYTAYGNGTSDKSDTNFYTTALKYSYGLYNTLPNYMALMVGGDVIKDGVIDSKDINFIKNSEATSNLIADITGDGFINADDRIIVSRNLGKKSSISKLNLGNKAKNEKGLVDEVMKSKIEKIIFLQSDPSIKLYLDASISNNILTADISLEAISSPFYLGSSTIAIEFDTTALKYRSFNSNNNVPFNLSKNGYLPIRTSPANNTWSIKNIRTIEIDYDYNSGKPGALLENKKTYIATFKFDVINSKIIKFNWHPSTTINSTETKLKDNNIKRDSLSPIYPFTLSLTYPNGGEEFRPNTPIEIKWNFTGNTKINLEYSTNNGLNWIRINTNSIDIKAGKFAWKIPTTYSLLYLVRIVDNDTGIEIDRSDTTFSVVSGFAYFIKPAAIDQVYIGASQTKIIWASGGLSEINLLFSSNGGTSWTTIFNKVNATKSSVDWKVPEINTTNAVIRMVDNLTKDTIVDSDLFKIKSGYIVFLRPNFNETIFINRQYNIRWNNSGVDTFDLQVSYDGGANWEYLKTNLKASLGIYKWLVPNKETQNALLRAIWRGVDDLEFGISDKFNITTFTDIAIENTDNQYCIYPNPSSDFILISNHKVDFNLEIYDLFGNKIFQNTVKEKLHIIDISKFTIGTYLLKINSKDGINCYKKFIKN